MLPDGDTLAHFHFLRPAFALLLLPWLAMLALRHKRRGTREQFGGIIAPHILEHLRLPRTATSWFNPRSVTTLFTLLMLLVLMGPSWRQQPSPLHEDEAAVVILLDMSVSMQQNDVQPTRLQRAKQKIADLLALRAGKKVALVVYSGSAHTVLSLTADSEIVNQYLSAATPAIMPRAGKFPEYALANIDRILHENSAPATVLLLTDGLGAASAEPLVRYFNQQPHQLIILGVGTSRHTESNIPLEEETLKALADDADGHYVELTVDDRDIRQINRRIDSHYVVLENSALPWKDSGYWLLLPAMLLFLMWFRRGWTLTWSVLLIPVLLAAPPNQAWAQNKNNEQTSVENDIWQRTGVWFSQLWLTENQRGRLLLQLGHHRKAAEAFSNPQWKGLAYYYAEDFMLAAQYFSRSDTPDALFNEANARAHARDYLRALSRYDELLQRAPNYPGANENRHRVKTLIDDINRLSESQQQEPGVSSEEKTLDSEDAIPAQGADEIAWNKTGVQQLSAEELLADPELTQMWLRGVSHNPSTFLAVKFSMQLNNAKTEKGLKP